MCSVQDVVVSRWARAGGKGGGRGRRRRYWEWVGTASEGGEGAAEVTLRDPLAAAPGGPRERLVVTPLGLQDIADVGNEVEVALKMSLD